MTTAPKPTYGYWVSRNEIIEVTEEDHIKVGFEVLAERFGMTPQRVAERVRLNMYAVMERLGYVRVINYKEGGYGVEHWHTAKLSRLQADFVRDAQDVDLYSYIRIITVRRDGMMINEKE